MKKILVLAGLFLSIGTSYGFENGFNFTVNNKNYVYNEDEFKFYESKNGTNHLLTTNELQSIFPNYRIIYISDFKNRKYTFKNPLFKSQKVLILNDTKRTFHGFSIFPISSRSEFQNSTEIKSLITIYSKKNVRIKHFGGDEFEIVVK